MSNLGAGFKNWNENDQALLARLVDEGKSASAIAPLFGVTRNAIIGRANRTGLKLHGQRVAVPREPKAPRVRREPGPRARYTPEERFSRRSALTRALWDSGKMRAAIEVPHEKRIAALADFLAGKGLDRTAKKYGVGRSSIHRLWLRNPALVAEAKPIAERLKAEMDQALEARRLALRYQREEAAARRAQEAADRAVHNAPILARMSDREAWICRLFLGGETLQSVGDAAGVTRERIRQIVTHAKNEYGLDVGGRLKGKFLKYQSNDRKRAKASSARAAA